MPRGMLPSMKLAGLDIGTTTISGLVLDPESGQVDEVMTEPNDASISGKAPWEVLQDPVAILRTAKRFTSAFLDRHRDVSAVGITGQMHGILYVDPKGRAVSPLITWQDRRGEQLDESGVSFASRVAAAAGRQASTGMGSVTHYYNVRTGQVPEDASALCTIADYVAMGLTGMPAPVIDATNAASLGCFDVRSLRFRTDVLESLGIDPGLFPRIDASYPALGEIRRGVPVFVALGDNQAGFLGSVPDLGGSMLANVGTGSQLSVPLVDCADIEGIDIRPLPFGGYLGVGAALCGGRIYALLRDFFTRTLRMFGSRDAVADWSIMNAVDRSALPGEPLLVDTRLGRYPTGSRAPWLHRQPRSAEPDPRAPGRRGASRHRIRAFRILQELSRKPPHYPAPLHRIGQWHPREPGIAPGSRGCLRRGIAGSAASRGGVVWRGPSRRHRLRQALWRRRSRCPDPIRNSVTGEGA